MDSVKIEELEKGIKILYEVEVGLIILDIF